MIDPFSFVFGIIVGVILTFIAIIIISPYVL